VIQGSVYNDLIQPGGGADRITLGPGNDEIQDTTAHLNGITVTDFGLGDWFDFTDLNPSQVTTSYQGGALHVLANSIEVASITLPQPGPGLVFVASPDGSGGTTIALGSPPPNAVADGTNYPGANYLGANYAGGNYAGSWAPSDVHAGAIGTAAHTADIGPVPTATWSEAGASLPVSQLSAATNHGFDLLL
jgi:hypothetical protein